MNMLRLVGSGVAGRSHRLRTALGVVALVLIGAMAAGLFAGVAVAQESPPPPRI